MKNKFLTHEEERAIIEKWQKHRDQKAFNLLYSKYRVFIKTICSKFKNHNLSMDDIEAEAVRGFFVAVEKFDPSGTNGLSAYSRHWILCYIRDYIIKNTSIVTSLGKTNKMKNMFYNLKKEISAYYDGDMTIPLNRYLAEKFSVSESYIAQVSILFDQNNIVNLDQSVDSGEDGSLDFSEIIADPNANGEEKTINKIERNEKMRIILKASDVLSVKEKEIIQMRFFSAPTKKLDEISKILQLSKERVRQIESEAIRKIKDNINLVSIH